MKCGKNSVGLNAVTIIVSRENLRTELRGFSKLVQLKAVILVILGYYTVRSAASTNGKVEASPVF